MRYLHGLEPMNIDMEKEFRILSGQDMMSKNLLSIDKLVGPNDLVFRHLAQEIKSSSFS